MLTDDRRVVPTILLAQASVSVVLAGLFGLWDGRIIGASILAGGMVAVIPNAFFAARLLKPRASAVAMLRSAWIGELGKILLTVLLFGVIFTSTRPVSAPAVFGGFIAAQLMVLCAPLLGGAAGSRAHDKS